MKTKKIALLLLVGIFLFGASFALVSKFTDQQSGTSSLETQSQVGGIQTTETPVVFKDITSQEADTLIRNNKENQNFVIIDVRTLEERDAAVRKDPKLAQMKFAAALIV